MTEVEKLIEIYQRLEDAGLMVVGGKRDSAELMVSQGVVIPTRCEKCFYFVPMDDVRESPLYKDYPIDLAVDMGFDGLCGSMDLWANRDDYCSGGREEVSDGIR